VALAKAVRNTKSLQILDVSFNSFGTGKTQTAAKKWAKTFKINISLIHVDFSFNSFKANDI